MAIWKAIAGSEVHSVLKKPENQCQKQGKWKEQASKNRCLEPHGADSFLVEGINGCSDEFGGIDIETGGGENGRHGLLQLVAVNRNSAAVAGGIVAFLGSTFLLLRAAFGWLVSLPMTGFVIVRAIIVLLLFPSLYIAFLAFRVREQRPFVTWIFVII